MTQELSSLMDGELGAQEAGQALQACCASEGHKRTWYLYHVIGDSMRGQAPRRLSLPDVLDALQAQPTVLAPRRKLLETTFARVTFAAAASVATVGVVGWIGTQGGQAPTPIVAKAAGGLQPVANTVTQPALDVQDYLAAHRQIPPPELYRQVNNRAAARAR
ncbi:MAG TPA: sigma-E factor negative regulatory protein [Usitatibacter sp.]|jgi:sigma-E factor negative regulatory protein RseA|nr:sigma-E factor negative regulatory protein [Usitatibacter sp.]